MGMMSDFKDFAMRGNVVDMAVGIVIGGAFGKIVSSFVADVLMPPIGYMMGGVDFTDLVLRLSEGAEPVVIKYGVFIQSVVDFIIIAFAIFMVVKAMSSLKQEQEEEPEEDSGPSEKDLLVEIRDALTKR